jgi:hypothetical protein
MLKMYACFMFIVISSHICVLIFKSCPFMTYKCTAIGSTPKSFDYQLFGQFLNFPKLPRQFKLDMSGYQASGYIKGVCTPSNPKPPKSSPLLSFGDQGSPKAILDLLHRVPSVSRRFGSLTFCDFKPLLGFFPLRYIQGFFKISLFFVDLLQCIVSYPLEYL